MSYHAPGKLIEDMIHCVLDPMANALTVSDGKLDMICIILSPLNLRCNVSRPGLSSFISGI